MAQPGQQSTVVEGFRPGDCFDICMGNIPLEQVKNIARELRYLWRHLEMIYPNGDRKQRAQLKVTRDRFGQYHFYLNHQAIKIILLLLKDVPGMADIRKQAMIDRPCPPEVPDFLRWD